MDFKTFINNILDFILTKKVLGTIITIIAAIVLVKIFTNIVSKVLIKGKTDFEIKRRKTIIELVASVFKWIIYIFAGLIILDFHGVNTRSLIASLGVAGAVLGLALQDTLKDLISGVSLILENYLAVGDTVTYNDFTGEVIELGLRVTKIKKASGEVMVVANRNIDTIINLSQKKANILIEIDTAYEEKESKVERILMKVIDEAIVEKLILPDSAYLGVNDLGTSSVKYLVKINCHQNKRYEIRREMLKRIKKAYEKNNIKIPYSQIEVHHGRDI